MKETTLNVMACNVMASVNGTSFVSYVNITERGFLIIILLIWQTGIRDHAIRSMPEMLVIVINCCQL